MAILTGLWCRHSKSSMSLSQSFPSRRSGKARPQTGFHFMVQKRPVPGSVPGSSHPIIQKEVDGLLAKKEIEPPSDGSGFYFSMFVVPKCTGGLWPILNLKHFNRYMQIPSFKMPTIRNVWQLI